MQLQLHAYNSQGGNTRAFSLKLKRTKQTVDKNRRIHFVLNKNANKEFLYFFSVFILESFWQHGNEDMIEMFSSASGASNKYLLISNAMMMSGSPKKQCILRQKLFKQRQRNTQNQLLLYYFRRRRKKHININNNDKICAG